MPRVLVINNANGPCNVKITSSISTERFVLNRLNSTQRAVGTHNYIQIVFYPSDVPTEHGQLNSASVYPCDVPTDQDESNLTP